MPFCDDCFYMELAIREAEKGMKAGEVPVGAVMVDSSGRLVARAFNSPVTLSDPTAHAEINLLRKAGQMKGNYRLCGTTLYVTLEPCPMCAGALVHARIRRLVFGAPDPKTGACGSIMDITGNRQLNHHIEVTGGVLADRCVGLLRKFFINKRGGKG